MSNLRQTLQKPWIIVTGVVTALGAAAIWWGGSYVWLVLLLMLVAAAIAFGILWSYRRWREGRQAAQFRAGLNQNASKAPGNVHDPGRRVELDRLRQKFNEGFHRVIEEGRRKGVDFLYRHPWIMVVGEPGSGKTEAVRHSGIVSPRMQDELQGVGGTLNMDWWFTERAVILDTAGRMVFEEEAGSASNEFQEFLRLLRKGRPLTPINGLLVTVSADTLVGGTDEQIRERSTKLGEKIAQIQSVLEVRFPVYVVVTKCDKITGFREFFESLDDPAMLNQILGWSNPEGLDVPFKAEQVEEHLSGVIDTLRYVRLRLLDRPGGMGGGKRRTDEVDSLFAFPHGLKVLAPRLKLYLEPVFAAGEWSASAPLFVRGVYFSSALWQGAVLDQELAAALGVAVDKLGDEGKVFRRDRALFLRDLFVEKMLLERGLVTASHRTEGIVSRRRVITWSTLAVVLIIGIGAFSWAHSTLNGGVANEVELWRLAKANHTSAGFAPLIDRSARPGEWEYAGDRLLTVDSESKPSGENSKPMRRVVFHRELEASTQKELSIPFVFRFGSDVNELRRKAQNTIFVTDVVQPLVQASRDLIAHDNKWEDQHTQVLSTLIQIETALQAGGAPVPKGEVFLGPLLKFGVRPLDSNDAKNLFTLFDASYHTPAGGVKQSWPPAHLGAGVTLAENSAIKAGITNLKGNRQERKDEVEKRIRTLGELRDALVEFRKFEETLVATRRLELWKKEIDRYSELRNKVDRCIKAGIKDGVFAGNVIQMEAANDRILGEFRTGKEELRKTIMARPFAPVLLDADALAKFSLLKEVDAELSKLSEGESEQVLAASSETKRLEMRELDQQFLRADAAGVKRFEARVELFKNLVSSPSGGPSSGEPRLIGNLAKSDRVIGDLAAAEKTTAPTGEAARSVFPSSDPVPRAARELLMELYEIEFDKFLDDYARFPLVTGRTGKSIEIKDLPVVRRRLGELKDDVDYLNKSMGVGGRPLDLKRRLENCLELLNPILLVLVNAEGEMAQVRVSYPGQEEQLEALKQFLGKQDVNRNYVGWNSINMRVNFGKVSLHTRAAKDGDLGEHPCVGENFSLGFYATDTASEGVQLTPFTGWQLFQQMLDASSASSPLRSDDNRKWRVVFSLPDKGPEKSYFALWVSFPSKLPDRASWPKWAKLENKRP